MEHQRLQDASNYREVFGELATDGELLAIFIEKRSRDAAEILVRRHGPMVAGVVRRMLHHPNDAEDAFQATFLVLFQSAAKVRKASSLASWLYGVAYRTARRIRQKSKQRSEVAAMEPVVDKMNAIDPLERLAQESHLEFLDRELNELPDTLRACLIEHHLLGFTAPQIAERMNMSVSAVEGRLRRGRAVLRQRLARRGISLSVSVAVAAAYQQPNMAQAAHAWTSTLLQSDVFQQSLISGSVPPDTNLFSLVQREVAMRSVFGNIPLTLATVAGMTASLVGFNAFFIGDEPSSTTYLVASAEATEPSQSTAEVNVSSNSTLEINPGAGTNQNGTLTINKPAGTTTNNNPNALVLQSTLQFSESKDDGTIVLFTRPKGPTPNWMIEGGTIAEEEDKARELIRGSMRNRVSCEFNNTPLRHALEFLSAEAQVAILIDEVALAAGTATPEDPVTLRLPGEISLQRILKTILGPLELTYVVEPDYIAITTKAEGQARVRRCYDLAYLLPNDELVEGLVTVIQSTIVADWDRDGGTDTIQILGSMMIVACPEEIHEAIEGLLYDLSKADLKNLQRVRLRPSPAPGGGAGTGPVGGGGMF